MENGKGKDLSLMMSIYNEESCLGGVVEDLIKEFKGSDIDFELFLVNNGSYDGSQKIIDKLKKKYPSYIKVVIIEENRKLGGAVNLVTKKYLKGKVIGFTCADGEVSAKDTVKLARKILKNKKLSLVKTIRLNRVDGLRIYVSFIYNFLVRLLFGIRTRDVNGWPVLIRHDDFKKMHLRDYSWGFQLEYLYQIKKLRKDMGDIEVEHQSRRGGVSKISIKDILVYTLQVFSYRLETILGR